jgi:hypothetical protein
MATSNQKSREVHLAEEEALEDYPFPKLNHFSAGFWHAGRFSVQLYITNGSSGTSLNGAPLSLLQSSFGS